MSNLREALWKDYNENSIIIDELSIGTAEYKTFLDERDKIRNELIKNEQIMADKEVKLKQIESDNFNEKKKNIINIGTFAISTIISLYAINKTFKFDQDATITSTLGRNILNGFIPKIFKK